MLDLLKKTPKSANHKLMHSKTKQCNMPTTVNTVHSTAICWRIEQTSCQLRIFGVGVVLRPPFGQITGNDISSLGVQGVVHRQRTVFDLRSNVSENSFLVFQLTTTSKQQYTESRSTLLNQHRTTQQISIDRFKKGKTNVWLLDLQIKQSRNDQKQQNMMKISNN